MHKFFDRQTDKVADALVGKILSIGEIQCTILDVLPRTEKDNARWLKSKPLFAKNPVDVYVSSFRGTFLLFLRTGATNTCVRIQEISIEGETIKIKGPGRVCKALGINSERTGDLEFDGNVITITWH